MRFRRQINETGHRYEDVDYDDTNSKTDNSLRLSSTLMMVDTTVSIQTDTKPAEVSSEAGDSLITATLGTDRKTYDGGDDTDSSGINTTTTMLMQTRNESESISLTSVDAVTVATEYPADTASFTLHNSTANATDNSTDGATTLPTGGSTSYPSNGTEVVSSEGQWLDKFTYVIDFSCVLLVSSIRCQHQYCSAFFQLCR